MARITSFENVPTLIIRTSMSMSQFINAHSDRESRICVTPKWGKTLRLLVERLGVGGGGRDVGIAGGLVGAGGLLEVLGGKEVGCAGLGVGEGVVGHVRVHEGGKFGEHFGRGVCGATISWHVVHELFSSSRLQQDYWHSELSAPR
jgi:hypothetical protein